ncbi:MAG: hypothetical protein AAGF44_05835 [Pseudomonadota bacterium]
MAEFKKAPTIDTIAAPAQPDPIFGIHPELVLWIVFLIAVGLLFFGLWPRKPRKQDYEQYHPDNFGKGRKLRS